MVSFVCACGRQFSLSDDRVGHRVRCPACGAVGRVPPPLPEQLTAADILPDPPGVDSGVSLPIDLGVQPSGRGRNRPSAWPIAKFVVGSLITIGVLLVVLRGIGPDVRQVLPAVVPNLPRIPRPVLGLSTEQELVRTHILKHANKPESVWFEEWHPAITIPEARFLINYQILTAETVVHTIYRSTYPVSGEVRRDSLFYIKDGKVVTESTRSVGDDFDDKLEKYYGRQ